MVTKEMATSNSFDAIIIGAGISGINAAYRLQEGIPDYSYAILEGRMEMGGTWSLFKYPGIRSDSDLHTFGFPWDPWTEDRSIASAPSILSYMKTVAARHGIDQHIKFGYKVLKMDWKSDQQRWMIDVLVNDQERKILYAKSVLLGTGYYDYKQGLAATISGLENFKGTIVHPQFWPDELDYKDKKVVIVGSGATAVTILPAMTEKAAHVTMLQRSPGYFVSLPLVSPIDKIIRKWLPMNWAYSLIRLRFIMGGFLFFQFCRLFPKRGIALLRSGTEPQLPKNIPFEPHFVPSYNPWEQRMCITPGGDFFEALRTGKSDIVTDRIETVTETGVKLQSGSILDADIIITATGLKLQLFGGIPICVDGEQFQASDKYVWKGAMLQDVPNLTFVFGYTNASWTLGADATAQLWVRLLKNMRKTGMTSVLPKVENPDTIKEVPYLNLNSTYIKTGSNVLPKGGSVAPWAPRSNYIKDIWHAKWGDIATGLQFSRVATE